MRQTLVLRDLSVPSPDRRRVPAVLHASLELERGSFAVLFGDRRSGRTALLRAASGEVAGATGRISVRSAVGDEAAPALGQVVYCSPTLFAATGGRSVLGEVAVPLLARNVAHDDALQRSSALLGAVDARHLGDEECGDLIGDETVRCAIAQALACSPTFLLVDDASVGIGAGQRNKLSALFLNLARDRCIGILAVATEMTDLAGASQLLHMERGRVQGDQGSQVIRLRARGSRR